MYFHPCRRRGRRGVAGARVRQMPVEAHEGLRRDFLRRHEMEAAAVAEADPTTRQAFVARLLTRTADSRNLRLAWDHVAASDGQAPGADGLRCGDLDDAEAWDLVRRLGRDIRSGSYQPGRDRTKQIPKASGVGTRTLTIPSVIDRLVQRAVVQTLQPLLDPLLDERCLGYRPSSDRNKALALAEKLAVKEQRWIWLTQDIRNAFDNVAQRRLLDVVAMLVPDEGMVTLFEKLVLTGSGRGLRQGGNLSPLLLNLYLHHFLDRKWRRQSPDLPLLRWADDLLVLCRTTGEADQAMAGLANLLRPAGMTLKFPPEKAIHDLRNREAEWIGYRLSQGGEGLRTEVAEGAWTSLAEKLEQAHEKPCPPLRVIQSILGWVEALGPCYEATDLPMAYARIVSLANSLSFDEIPTQREIRRTWAEASRRWRTHRKV